MIIGVMIVAVLSATLSWRLVVPANAHGGGGYELTRSTTASSYSAGAGGYALSGTAGQAEAQGWSGGGYTLFGGFWGGGRIRPVYRIWLPFLGMLIIVHPGTNGTASEAQSVTSY
jgi:hypothetical protein